MWWLIIVSMVLVVIIGVLLAALQHSKQTIARLQGECVRLVTKVHETENQSDRRYVEVCNLQNKYSTLHTAYEEIVNKLQEMARRRHKKIEQHSEIEA